MQKAVTFNETGIDIQGIEWEIDALILSYPGDFPWPVKEIVLPAVENEKFYRQLINSMYKPVDKNFSSNILTTELGSYLSSRLLLRGFSISIDNHCLYMLCDSIRKLLPVETIRWRYVMQRFLATGWNNKAAVQLQQQSSRFINSLSVLYNSNEIELEKTVLGL